MCRQHIYLHPYRAGQILRNPYVVALFSFQKFRRVRVRVRRAESWSARSRLLPGRTNDR